MSRLVRVLIGVVVAVAWSGAATSGGQAEREPVVSEWQTFIQAVADGATKATLPAGVSNVVITLTKFPEAQRDQLLDWLREKMTRAVLTDKFDRVGRFQAFERCLATGTECDELRRLAARGDWDSSGDAPAGTEPPAAGPAPPPQAETPPAQGPPQDAGAPPEQGTAPVATPPQEPATTEPPATPEPPDPSLPVLAPNETACCRFTNPFTGGPSCSSTQDPRDCRDRLRGTLVRKHSCVNTEACVPD